MGNKGQSGYPSDVTDEEWAFVVPYLALCQQEEEPLILFFGRISGYKGLEYLIRTEPLIL